MSLTITTTLTAEDGQSLSSAHGRVKTVYQFDEESVTATLRLYRGVGAYNNGRRAKQFDEIPFDSFSFTFAIADFRNPNNKTMVQDVIAEILENGDSSPNWGAVVNAPATWAGLGTSTVTVSMT